MAARYLLDTHIVVRWLAEPKKLSRDQARILREAVHRGEAVALSSITLLEIAVLLSSGHHRIRADVDELLAEIEENPIFEILPLTTEIAAEVARRPLSDAHRRLLDERILDEERNPDDFEPWSKAKEDILRNL